ncbi:hypothetical protein [Rufibacter tibetensis]|uniref:Uncharacterized protein n=1 Tax=Rufibacter tibetensis TaxID=512763 RepID=A0A0P0CNC4_9BACT|nr:hypothetical protein [Rufibacter tibetensis]ALI98621.1 hypothetical protein DC20_06135 [Rufibacter tibetensis]
MQNSSFISETGMRRLIVLLFLLPLWAYGGCQEKQEPDTPQVAAVGARPKSTGTKRVYQPNYNNTASIKAFYQRVEMLSEEHPEVTKASAFINNPFLPVAEPVLKHYTEQVRTACKIVKDTVTNLHNARYIDTLVMLNFDSSTVELYYPIYTKRFLLSYADIKSPNLALKNGIKVGMSRQDLLEKLQGYKLFIKEQKNVIEVCDWERNSWLRFNLSKGKISGIQYEGYID